MKTLDYFRNRLHNKTCKNNFWRVQNESELEKILMGGILLSASAVLLTACGAEKRKLKMKAVQQIKQLVT